MTDSETQSVPPVFQSTPSSAPYVTPGNYDTAAIAHLRWKDDEITTYILEVLGGCERIDDGNGMIVLRQVHTPIMNDEGIRRVIAFIKSLINPTVALSNIDETKANVLIRQNLHNFARIIATHKDEYGIKQTGDLYLIKDIIKTYTYSQLYRSVNGHESKNFRTETIEQTMKQDQTMHNTNPGLFGGWKKSKG